MRFWPAIASLCLLLEGNGDGLAFADPDCHLNRRIELAILVDSTYSNQNVMKKMQGFLPGFMKEMKKIDPGFTLSLSAYSGSRGDWHNGICLNHYNFMKIFQSLSCRPRMDDDTEKKNHCHMPLTPLTGDLDHLEKVVRDLRADALHSKAENPFLPAGYVASKYARFTPDHEHVLHLMLIITDEAPRARAENQGYDPRSHYENSSDTELLCDSDDINVELVGEIMREAQVYPIILIPKGLQPNIFEHWNHMWPQRLGYEAGQFLAKEFEAGDRETDLSKQFLKWIIKFACEVDTAPSFPSPETPPEKEDDEEGETTEQDEVPKKETPKTTTTTKKSTTNGTVSLGGGLRSPLERETRKVSRKAWIIAGAASGGLALALGAAYAYTRAQSPTTYTNSEAFQADPNPTARGPQEFTVDNPMTY